MTTKHIRFGGAKLQFKKFNISEMEEHCTIAIIAKRGSGKTFLAREIMYHKRHIPGTIIISKTEKLNRFYTDFIGDSFIYSEYESCILSNIYERQKLMNEDNQKREMLGKKPKDDRIMLIMDDCMSSKGGWLKDPNISELFFNGRHHHLSFILMMQFALGIPPEFRSNFDYVFLLNNDIKSDRKRLYDHYAGIFPSFDIFESVFDQITEDYGVLVINNKITSKDLTDKVFWYKAKKTPEFRVGNKKFINYHKNLYDENWNNKVPLFDLNNYTNKRNHVKLIVDKVK
jgi:ABC-type oligopeptide transport system ATPase subunit